MIHKHNRARVSTTSLKMNKMSFVKNEISKIL